MAWAAAKHVARRVRRNGPSYVVVVHVCCSSYHHASKGRERVLSSVFRVIECAVFMLCFITYILFYFPSCARM